MNKTLDKTSDKAVDKTAERKKGIRQNAINARETIPMTERCKHEKAIIAWLFALEEFKNAKRVLFYASFNSEVNTELMIVEALDMGKTVLMPKVDRETNSLTKHVINAMKELSPGYMGIPEPTTTSQLKVEEIDMLVIPGVAFDPSGRRIGYGGGYYDRLLPRIKGERTIAALAFEAQVFESLPSEPHDIPVDYIVTEKRIINCHGQG